MRSSSDHGLVAVLALCACNQVFGLKDTRPVDARYFDTPADAPFTCSPIGENPVFAAALHQDLIQFCDDYTVVGDRAVAACIMNGLFVVSEGPVDAMLAAAPGIPSAAGNDNYDLPRLSSNGQELYVRHFDYGTNAQDVLMFARGGDGVWQPGPAPPFGRNLDDTYSTIVSGPTGDRLFVANDATNTMNEWVHEATGWRDAGPIAISGLIGGLVVGLNPTDSRRALVYGVDHHTYYTDRADETAPFRAGVRVAEIPEYAFDAAMTADCGRVYFVGLHSVFYVRQP